MNNDSYSTFLVWMFNSRVIILTQFT